MGHVAWSLPWSLQGHAEPADGGGESPVRFKGTGSCGKEYSTAVVGRESGLAGRTEPERKRRGRA